MEERQSGVGSGPSYGLGCLPLHMQVPWLKVLFVILYKVRGVGQGVGQGPWLMVLFVILYKVRWVGQGVGQRGGARTLAQGFVCHTL